MFNYITVGLTSPNASDILPSENDCDEILSKLNNEKYSERIEPDEIIFPELNNAYIYSKNTCNNRVNCHTVARYLQDKFALNGFKQSYGYLCEIDTNGIFIIRPNIVEMMKKMSIQDLIKNSIVTLDHHSVILDSKGNYIECIPEHYPLDKYIFIPHNSGRYGYQLIAHIN